MHNKKGFMKFLSKFFKRADADNHRKVREVVLEKYDFNVGPSPEGPVFAMDRDITIAHLREMQQELRNGPHLIGVNVYIALPVLIVTGKITEAQAQCSKSDQIALSRQIRELVCTDPEVLYMLACTNAIDIKPDEAKPDVLPASSPDAPTTREYAAGRPDRVIAAIKGLDEVLKCLFATLLGRYYTMFPKDPEESNLHRAGVVLNELVVEDLRGDQVEFRQANAELVDREKREVMMLEEVRKGVLSFLAAKGGLYRSWGHPDADIWVSEAKKIDPEIAIPAFLEEVQGIIVRYLVWYQQHV